MPPFTIRAVPRFQRLYRSLLKKHPEFALLYTKALGILRADPYNKSRHYPIKKLVGVKRDEGQYRIRFQRFRIRYDIYGQEVLLQYCGLRREDTYE
jgi:hypothetical protein